MTSAKFDLIPVSSITVDREERQRKELTGIDELADSIRRLGLINPIVVTRDHVLVAGERRLTAHKQLGFDQIAVQYAEDLDELELQMLELEENVKRVDLSWQDQVRAVARFEELKKSTESRWTKADTAEALGMSRANVTKYLNVNRFLEEGKPEVCDAPRLSQAISYSERAIEREKSSALGSLRTPALNLGQTTSDLSVDLPSDEKLLTPDKVEEALSASKKAEILNVSFHSWSKEILEEPYNFIHCDFPYGANTGDNLKGQSGGVIRGGYEDKPEIYWDLLDTFCARLDNFCAPSAHLIFWFSLDFYAETKKKLESAGWAVNPFPLIWGKGNTGILPDANRGPRRVYETALFASRGDRKIVQAVGNLVNAPVSKEIHMSEKPREMLKHFFRMTVDQHSKVLDPTAGSGNAIAVAEEMGAYWSTGLEINKKYADAAKENVGV